MLAADSLQEAEEIIKLLSPLELATREMCGDQYVTASKIIPIVHILQQQITDLNFETTSALNMKLQEMKKRFGKAEEISLLAIATLLDSR